MNRAVCPHSGGATYHSQEKNSHCDINNFNGSKHRLKIGPYCKSIVLFVMYTQSNKNPSA